MKTPPRTSTAALSFVTPAIRGALVLLLALTSSCFSPIGGGTCGTRSNCSSCTAQANCGWCGFGNECLEGSSSGPDGVTCPTPSWAWTASECSSITSNDGGPGNACSDITECGACADQSSCGFCTANGRCEPLTSMSTCGASNWVVDFMACPGAGGG